ncbi:MAG: hypothetical protein HY822_23820 [Acidobacteria bacterium]|nr:hypothetical protein [Acidobacteriota bacterium]
MPIGLFQTLLGALGVLFALQFGRHAIRYTRREVSRGTVIGWALRTTVCVYAVFYFGGWRWPFFAVFGLAAASLAGGVWLEMRPKKREDLAKVIFPDE